MTTTTTGYTDADIRAAVYARRQELREALEADEREGSLDRIFTVVGSDPRLIHFFMDLLFDDLAAVAATESEKRREQRRVLREVATALQTHGQALLDEAARLFEVAQLPPMSQP